jgi:COMPASS component SWD1
LVKILEGPKEEHGCVEWHPNKAMIAAVGLETGRIHIWSINPQQRWSALAPDFDEVEENVEYEEREDEFDIHPHEEIQKRRLDLEDDDVDPFTIEPPKGQDANAEPPFVMPVDLDFIDSEAEEEFVAVGRGEMRRKSPTEVREQMLDFEGLQLDGAEEKSKPKGRRN